MCRILFFMVVLIGSVLGPSLASAKEHGDAYSLTGTLMIGIQEDVHTLPGFVETVTAPVTYVYTLVTQEGTQYALDSVAVQRLVHPKFLRMETTTFFDVRVDAGQHKNNKGVLRPTRITPVAEKNLHYTSQGLRMARPFAPAMARAPEERLLVLYCTFPDEIVIADPLPAIHLAYKSPDTGMFSYMSTVSQGHISYTEESTTFVEAPRSLARGWINYNQEEGMQATLRALQDCITLWSTEYTITEYDDFHVYLGNKSPTYLAYPRLHLQEVEGRTVRGVALPSNKVHTHRYHALLAHEIIHTFGIYHGNNHDADGSVSDNHFDLMSTSQRVGMGYAYDRPHRPSAWVERLAGWEGAPQRHRDLPAPTTDTVHRVHMEGPASAGTYSLWIPDPANSNSVPTPVRGILLEMRTSNDILDALFPETALFVYVVNMQHNEVAKIVDRALPLTSIANTASSYLVSGESWVCCEGVYPESTRPEMEVAVHVGERTPSGGLQVEIVFGQDPRIFTAGFE